MGQFLLSATRTPNRPDLSTAWTGQSLGSRALSSTWNHSSYHWNWTATYRDLGENFRADDGFVPQVGIREGIVNASYVFYTTGFFSRVTPVVVLDSVADAAGHTVTRLVEPGVAFQGRSNLFAEIDYNAHEQERAGPNLLRNERWHVSVSFNPPGLVTSVSLDGHVGKSIDFVGNRGGHGGDFTFSTTGRPTRHLQIDANLAGQWLDFEGRRLFTAQIERLKATYVFSRTTFVRVIGQYLRTDFHPERYPVPVPKVSGGFQGSALFGYQVNWQTVLYAGYGDTRVLSNDAQLLSSARQLFVKLSYAFQR